LKIRISHPSKYIPYWHSTTPTNLNNSTNLLQSLWTSSNTYHIVNFYVDLSKDINLQKLSKSTCKRKRRSRVIYTRRKNFQCSHRTSPRNVIKPKNIPPFLWSNAQNYDYVILIVVVLVVGFPSVPLCFYDYYTLNYDAIKGSLKLSRESVKLN